MNFEDLAAQMHGLQFPDLLIFEVAGVLANSTNEASLLIQEWARRGEDWEFAKNCQAVDRKIDVRYVPIEMLEIFWNIVI